MTTRIEGTFAVLGWQMDAFDESPTRMVLSRIDQAWSGDADGTVTIRAVLHVGASGVATMAGVLRFEGIVAGRAGSFAASLVGPYDGREGTIDLKVASDSGVGRLIGVDGVGGAVCSNGSRGQWWFEINIP